MRRKLSAFIALWRAGVTSRFRLRGRYWRWRTETAFGDFSVTNREKLNAMIEYGAWIDHMTHCSEQGTFDESSRLWHESPDQ